MEEKKTIEQWKLELLPQPKDKRGWGPQEELKAGSKDWLYNSAKMLHKWAVGEEMTKEEFEAGLQRAATHYVRN